jgi:hypothetical protein
MKVIRVTNPEAFQLQPLLQLLDDAHHENQVHPPAKEVAEWMARACLDPDVEILVALEPGFKLLGYYATIYHVDVWAKHPWVVSVYAKSRAAKDALTDAVIANTRRRGFKTLRALNRSGASDRGYQLLWKKWVRVEVLGSAADLHLLDPSGDGTSSSGGDVLE